MKLLFNTFALVLLLSLSDYCVGCSTKTVFGSPLMAFDTATLKIKGNLKSFTKTWKVKKMDEVLQVYTLSLTSPQEAMPPAFTLEWNFPAVDVYSILASLDNESINEDSIMAALDYLVPQSVRAGKFLPMAYTIPEIVDVEDGDPFHDVRPIVFSISPRIAAVTNLGLRRLPFGIACPCHQVFGQAG